MYEVLPMSFRAKDIANGPRFIARRVIAFHAFMHFETVLFACVPSAHDIGTAPVMVNDFLLDNVVTPPCSVTHIRTVTTPSAVVAGHVPTASFPPGTARFRFGRLGLFLPLVVVESVSLLPL